MAGGFELMGLLFCVLKLSFRNVFRNKGKALVIGVILFLGGVVSLLGGATLNVVERNLKNSLVRDFFGHITVMPSSQENEKVYDQFIGSPLKVFGDAKSVLAVLREDESVARTLPYALGFLSLLSGHNNPIGYPPGCSVVGVDLRAYELFFDNIEFLEGGLASEGDSARGMLLSAFMRDLYFKFNGVLYLPEGEVASEHWPEIAREKDANLLNKENDLVLLGVSQKKTVMDIRAEILGVFRYKRFDGLWSELSLLDIDLYRQAMDMQGSEEEPLSSLEVEKLSLADDEASLLGLFGEGGSMFDSVSKGVGMELSAGSLRSLSGSVGVGSVGEGGYQLVAVKLKEGVAIESAVGRLNLAFREAKVEAKAVPWATAGGSIVSFVNVIRVVLYLVLGVIFLVAIVVIMNTLAMATLERVDELGTMRAIGSRRGFLAGMLLGETFVLAFFFGSLGMFAGGAATFALNRIGVPVENDFIQIFVGGEVFRPVLTPWDLGVGNLWLFVVTCLSVLYPLWVGRNISPLDAAVRD